MIDKDWPASAKASTKARGKERRKHGYIDIDHKDATCTVGLTYLNDFEQICNNVDFPWYKIRNLKLQTKIISYRKHTQYAKTKNERCVRCARSK